MKNNNFFSWYYSVGLKNLIQAIQNLLEFIPRFFSLRLFSQTLFQPWHRDVSLKNWEGVDLAKSLTNLIWNLSSRVIGAGVRLLTILVGLFSYILIFIFGIIFAFFYFVWPALFILAIVFLSAQLVFLGFLVFFSALIILGISYIHYQTFNHIRYRQMNIQQLNQLKWFYRIYERLGIARESIPVETFNNYEEFKKILFQLNVSVEECEKIIAWEIDRQLERENKKRFFSKEKLKIIRPLGLCWQFGYTPHLNKFAQDLTEKDRSSYSQFPFFGYQEEINLLEKIIGREQENNAVVVGVPGSGRRMLIHEFARRIRMGEYDQTKFINRRVLICDFSEIISKLGDTNLNPENFIHNLFHEAGYAGNVILVIENFEKYLQIGNRSFSFVDLINKYAPLPTVQIIGITTESAFSEAVNPNKMLMRNFEVIHLDEMSEEDTLQVLFNYFYGKKHTPFTFQSLRQIILDSGRYANQTPLPLRAINLGNEVLAFWLKNNQTKKSENFSPFITEEIVDQVMSQKTGIPIGKISAIEQDKLLSLEENFHRRIVGQNKAVQSVAEAVRRMRSGIGNQNKPAGSFLFLGPTGVGKTEMAKVLAEQYFGDEKKVIRIDMSEFQGEKALDRLLGSKELNQQGILSKTVKEHPYALLLLDEIEKAEKKVLDIFLQILDEGFVHDSFGIKLHFQTMIIIATSNAGALKIRQLMADGKNLNQAEEEILNEITEQQIFRPEFIARFDEVIIFHPLGEEDIPLIVNILLQKFAERFKAEKQIEISFGQGVVEEIIKQGFDKNFGARSLIRYIQNNITDILAKKIIQGNLQRGDSLHFTQNDMLK
jgi:ATP-dependent Clp protease ATP-binding subunit ClpA